MDIIDRIEAKKNPGVSHQKIDDVIK